jgi:polar amino acid transport system substrate-binding protein
LAITLALSWLVLAGCTRPPPQGGLARVKQSGVLRWGGDEQGGEPYVFEDPEHEGKLTGFEVEIADALAKSLGVRAEFVQNDWSTLIPSLERGTFDIAMNGLEVTPARADRVLFSRPYFLFAERLVARRGDGRISGLASLRALRVGTLANSLAWDMLQKEEAIAVPYEGVDEPFTDLESGRTDAVLLDDIIVSRYAPRHAGLAVVGDVGEGQYAIGLRKGEGDLAAAIDQALGDMIARGELAAILARWELGGTRQASLAERVTLPLEPLVSVSGRRLTSHQILLFLQGAGVTLGISCGAMVVAVLLGVGLALMRIYLPRGRYLATAYIELFRGTPVLLQLFVLYFGLARALALDAYSAAILGLGLNYAAYEAEIYRAGLTAVPKGQLEAAVSLGMSEGLALRRIILPQAFRFALPPMTNDFIALLKDSSLVSVITVVELTKRMSITAVDMRNWLVPGALCAGLYFAMSYPLSLLARRLEARLSGT